MSEVPMEAVTPEAGRPLVFRNATILTMDDAHTIEHNADLLVIDERIAAVGRQLSVPDGTCHAQRRVRGEIPRTSRGQTIKRARPPPGDQAPDLHLLVAGRDLKPATSGL